jgi:VCBS repeat-containing protein
VITDFNAGEGDRIDLSALGPITWGGQAALGGGTASDWYIVSGSTASLFVDVDGNGTADMRIDLQGVTSIAATSLIGVSTPSTPPPRAAAANPDTAAITEDAASAQVSGNVLSNDTSGLSLKLASVNAQKILSKTTAIPGKHGALAIDQDGRWTYTLNNGDPAVQALGVGKTLTETFTYAATGKGGTTVTSTLTVTINGSNDAPLAVADIAATAEDAAVTIDVLRNDSDKDAGDTLSVTSTTVTAGKGAATVNSDGTVKYDPRAPTMRSRSGRRRRW